MTDVYFRAGVGGVILNASAQILVLRRVGARDGAWQMPQGGIQSGETPQQALGRELREETGLASADFEVVSECAEWLAYEVPVEYRKEKIGWGQVQRWFLCRLLVPESRVKPDQVEFSSARWVAPEVLVRDAVAFRVPVYRRLVSEFKL